MFFTVQCIDNWIQEQKQENKISLFNLYGNFQIAWYFIECNHNPIVYMHFFFLGKIFTSPYKNWSPVPEIAFYLFIEDQIFASQEIWWVKLTPLWVTFSLPISCKQFKIPSVSETILTLFSLFFGGPRLRHSSRSIQHSKTVQFPK